MKYKDWTIVDWDGNLSLKLKCWRKSFRGGHVSVGIGAFDLICYSYGANSEGSMSSTRWRPNGIPQTEEAAKAMVDRNDGRYNSKDTEYP
jgi:hypothetical protein